MTTLNEFDYRYMDHIINMHDILVEYVREHALPMYEFANSARFYDLVADYSPELLDEVLDDEPEKDNEEEKIYDDHEEYS